MSGELEEKLIKIGFSRYESKVYSSLTKLCNAKMRELAELSGVPYQKVYDVVSRLEKKGFVKVINGKPKRVKLIDPNISFENYKQTIIEQIDKIVAEINTITKDKSKERSTVIEGRRQVMSFVRNMISEAKILKVVYPKIPGWLIKLLRNFNGELYLVVKSEDMKKVKGLRGKIKYNDEVNAKFMIFNDEITVVFTDESYATVESCLGCIIHSMEHFKLIFNSDK
ncbi:MAG: TrmB family transcriptional regulator [Sulfolobaceae archaeon]|nr:TrmB family transcriptional regulator [Sulfolobaceae archaeon]